MHVRIKIKNSPRSSQIQSFMLIFYVFIYVLYPTSLLKGGALKRLMATGRKAFLCHCVEHQEK